eukprot:6175443-Pleurochrysis_carterae.AAC.2
MRRPAYNQWHMRHIRRCQRGCVYEFAPTFVDSHASSAGTLAPARVRMCQRACGGCMLVPASTLRART